MNPQDNLLMLLSRKNHEDHSASKGFTSMTHYNLVHKFIPMPHAIKIPGAKSSGGERMGKARDDPSVEFGTCQEQKVGYLGSTKRQKESSLCFTDGLMPPQECGVGTKITIVQRQSRAPW